MELVGRSPIHPVLFFSGKVSGYLTWVLLGLDLLGLGPRAGFGSDRLDRLAMLLSGFAVLIIVLSAVDLGSSLRLGLPTGRTQLRTRGIYRLSRNPMYVGFNTLTLASILARRSTLVLVLGVYSLVVYHFIILAEEEFLRSAFGKDYEQYRARVRRYL